MQSMKARLRHFYEIVAGALLSLMGFVGCHGGADDSTLEDHFKETPNAYGTPNAHYIIKGTVAAEDSGEPVPGIKITARMGYPSDGRTIYDEKKFTSDANGKAVTSFEAFPGGEDRMEIVFEDIDGEDNGGAFQKDTLRTDAITVERTQKGDGNWYDGEFTISFEAKLKKQ